MACSKQHAANVMGAVLALLLRPVNDGELADVAAEGIATSDVRMLGLD